MSTKTAIAVAALLAAAAGGVGWLLGGTRAPAVELAREAGAMSGTAAASSPAAASMGSASAASTAAAVADVSAELPAPPRADAPPAQALRALLRCHAADSCRFSRGEGLDEHFEVASRLVQQLERLGAEGNASEQAAWARELMSYPDGHVQAAALALAARLPPSPETVNAAVSALGKSYDAVLLRQAYPVLRQWQQVGLTSGYDDMFVGLVHTGGWQAAQSVAENIGPFLNAGNVGRFEQVARQLQPGARQQALLKSLSDYRLQQQGG